MRLFGSARSALVGVLPVLMVREIPERRAARRPRPGLLPQLRIGGPHRSPVPASPRRGCRRGAFYEYKLSGRYPREDFFGPGACDDWKTTMLRATGEELNSRYFVETV